MSKIVTSPVLTFPGSITLPDRLTLHQVAMWERSLSICKRLPPGDAQRWEICLPAAAEIVQEWNVEGVKTPVTVATFDFFPYDECSEFTRWVSEEISKLNLREKTIPNDSKPPLDDGSTAATPPQS